MEQNGTRRYTYTVACVYILYPVHEKCRQGADSRQSGSVGSPVTFRDPPWPLCRGAGTHRSGGQSHHGVRQSDHGLAKGENVVFARSLVSNHLSLSLSPFLSQFSPENLPRVSSDRQQRKIERRCARVMFIVNATG